VSRADQQGIIRHRNRAGTRGKRSALRCSALRLLTDLAIRFRGFALRSCSPTSWRPIRIGASIALAILP
jgi:hypothetical protein